MDAASKDKKAHRLTSSGKIILLCVFHKERTPSLHIWPSGLFCCHGCQEKGHVRDNDTLLALFHSVYPPEQLLHNENQLLFPFT